MLAKKMYYSYTYKGTIRKHQLYLDVEPIPIFYIVPYVLFDRPEYNKYKNKGRANIFKGTNVSDLAIGIQYDDFFCDLTTNINQINKRFRRLSIEHLFLYTFHDYLYPTFIREFLELRENNHVP